MSDPSTRELFALHGRVAVVTGASRGFGRVIAQALAESGASIGLVARGADDLQRVADEIVERHSVRALVVKGDVSNVEEATRIAAQVEHTFGQIDVLVNAAGTIVRGNVEDTDPAEFDRVMRVNAHGTWAMCRAVIPAMKARGRGSIVNIASTLGVIGATQRSAYAASKGAVVQLTRSLAAELASHGIRVNAVAPGPFATDMTQQLQSSERWRHLLEHRVPMARIGAAAELRGPVLFLAAPASSFVTGVVLPVDGGWTAS